MTEEKNLESNQEVEETTNPIAPEGETNTESSELGVDESKNTEGEEVEAAENAVDYKAAYEKSQKILNKAEHTIVKLKKDKKKDRIDFDLSSIKQELRDELIRELEPVASRAMKSSLEEFRIEDREDYISDRIAEMTSNEYEAKMMRDFYTQKIQKGGLTKEAINQDLNLVKGMVQGLVSAPKIQMENRELKEALVSQKTVSNSSIGNSVKEKTSPGRKPTAEDVRVANKYFGGDVERYMKNKQSNLKSI